MTGPTAHPTTSRARARTSPHYALKLPAPQVHAQRSGLGQAPIAKPPAPQLYLGSTFHTEPDRDGPAAHHPNTSIGESDGSGGNG